MSYVTVPLRNDHKKAAFSCGKRSLDEYLHKQAKQDIKRKLAACFILEEADGTVKGYYTLSATSVPRSILPESIISKLPSAYSDLPATLIGRLARSKNYDGQRLGELLLLDALKRSHDIAISSIGSMAVIVDPLDEEAVSFYEKYQFIMLPDSGKMFLPMDTVLSLFRGA